MKCPKCSSEQPDAFTECSACGIILSRHHAQPSPQVSAETPNPVPLSTGAILRDHKINQADSPRQSLHHGSSQLSRRARISLSPPSIAALMTPLLLVVLVWSLNYVLADRLVHKTLNADPRNITFSLHAHYGYYILPNTLVLNLRKVEGAAPVDLFRGLFQSAGAFHAAGRSLERVVLARNGTPVFLMKGEDFRAMGAEYGAGQNPAIASAPFPRNFISRTARRHSNDGRGGGSAFSANKWKTPTRPHGIGQWACDTSLSLRGVAHSSARAQLCLVVSTPFAALFLAY